MFFRKKYDQRRYINRKKKFVGRLFFLIALLAYLLTAPRHIERVPFFSRIWSTDITGTEVEDSSEVYSTWIPFLGESELGYLSPEGKVVYREELQHYAAMSEGAHVNYTKEGETPGLYRARQESLVEIEPEGYPVFRNGSLYLLSGDRMSIISIDESGKERFRLDFASLITGFDVGRDLMVVGLLNGKAELFTIEGERRAGLKPQEERRPVYGAAVSPSEDTVSLVWGDDPQYVSLFETDREKLSEGEEPAERGRITRDQAVLTETLMRFSSDGNFLFYETASGCAILDIQDMEEVELDFSGSVFDFTSRGGEAPLYVLGNKEEEGFIRIYNKSGSLITAETIPGRITHFYPYGTGGVYTSEGRSVFIEGGRM